MEEILTNQRKTFNNIKYMNIKQTIIDILTHKRLKSFIWGVIGYGIALLINLVLQYSAELRLDPVVVAVLGVAVQQLTKELKSRNLLPIL